MKFRRLTRFDGFFFKPKAHKPVIAILAVQTSTGKVKLYRGTNMEVSMPTGSLCAERNVIGTALGKKRCADRFSIAYFLYSIIVPL